MSKEQFKAAMRRVAARAAELEAMNRPPRKPDGLWAGVVSVGLPDALRMQLAADRLGDERGYDHLAAAVTAQLGPINIEPLTAPD